MGKPVKKEKKGGVPLIGQDKRRGTTSEKKQLISVKRSRLPFFSAAGRSRQKGGRAGQDLGSIKSRLESELGRIGGLCGKKGRGARSEAGAFLRGLGKQKRAWSSDPEQREDQKPQKVWIRQAVGGWKRSVLRKKEELRSKKTEKERAGMIWGKITGKTQSEPGNNPSDGTFGGNIREQGWKGTPKDKTMLRGLPKEHPNKRRETQKKKKL